MNIGQAATESGVSQRMIRHYEKIGLIPARHGGAAAIGTIRMRMSTGSASSPTRATLGFPIDEIRSLLDLWQDRCRSSAEVKALAISRADELGRKADTLNRMRGALMELADDCAGDERPECPIIGRLASDDCSTSGSREQGKNV